MSDNEIKTMWALVKEKAEPG
ncbi:MAG: hypothetical protein K0R46_2836, partial [Herbinix sp.]|nr:hypothetical protein [Herbinix sp.]